MYSNALIYGKNPLERIVSLEVVDDQLEVFQQQDDGSIHSIFFPNRFWLLSPKWFGDGSVKLQGNQHYCYGKQYKERKEFMSERGRMSKSDVFSIFNPKEAIMVKDGYTYFKGLKPNEVSILSFDIETTGLKMNDTSKVLLISNTFRDSKGKVTRKLFSYENYACCGEMILDWSNWVQTVDPSILCTHNGMCYDLPYMHYCAGKTGHNLEIGRDGSNIQFEEFERKYRVDGSRELSYKRASIYGREIVDTMFLAYKYDAASKKYESYGLKNIIKQEGLEKKDRQFYDAGKIKDNYRDSAEWEKIKKYAIEDSDDALMLYDLMIPAFFYMTQSIPKSFQIMIESATGAQLNSLLVRSYLQEKYSIPKADDVIQYEGAISFGIPGIYRNVLKVDAVSEYPSCMIQYEVYDKKKDPKKNFFKMVETFTSQRIAHKKLAKDTGDKYYKDMEQAEKIAINSAYGLLGAPGLNFNSPQNAALVTKLGRECIMKSIEWASGKSSQYWIDKCKGENEDESSE